MSSAASGSSSPINISNYRAVLSNRKPKDSDVVAVAQKILRDPEFQKDVQRGGLTRLQKERLTAALEKGNKQGIDLKKYDSILRGVVRGAPDRLTILQKEKAALAEELTGKADAIYSQLEQAHKELARVVDLMRAFARKEGIVGGLDDYITRVQQKVDGLKLQVKEWNKGGAQRTAFMRLLDQDNNDVAGTIFNGLQGSLTSALKSVWLSSSQGLKSDVAALENDGKTIVAKAVRSLERTFSETARIISEKETSKLNREIANAESPQVSLQRLQKQKTALKKEVTRLVGLIRGVYQNLEKVLQPLVNNLTQLDVDYKSPIHKMLGECKAVLQEVKAQVKDWGEGGANWQIAMESLESEKSSGLDRVVSLCTHFETIWQNLLKGTMEGIPPDLASNPSHSRAFMESIDESSRLVQELRVGPFLVLQGEIKGAMELNQRINAVLRERESEA